MISRKTSPQPSPTPAAPQRPTLASISQRYNELKGRWDTLTARENELFATLRPLVAEVAKAGGYNTAATMPMPPAPEPPKDYRDGIKKLVGDIIPFKRPDAAPVQPVGDLKAKAAAISSELSDIAESKRLLWPELRRESFAASAMLVEALKPEYAAIAQRIVDALLALGAALADQNEFIRDIEAQSASTATLRRIVVNCGGQDPLDVLAVALRCAVEGGHVDPNTIPPELLKR